MRFSGVARLGHTWACALATRGHAPPVQIRNRIIDADSIVVDRKLCATITVREFAVNDLRYSLASMISEKRNTEYSQTVNWIHCKLRFALLRASIMSIRGARSSRHHAVSEASQGPVDLQLMEGQIH